MEQYLDIGYWFALTSGGQFNYYQEAFVITTVLLLMAVVIYFGYKFKFYKSNYRKIIRNSSSWLFFFSVSLAFLTFFRLENAILLSMRFWFLLWTFGFLAWVLLTIRAVLKVKNRIILREKLQIIKKSKKEEVKEVEKYLPKKGKKKKKRK